MTPLEWTARYREGNTPWDVGGPHPELVDRLVDARVVPEELGKRALVPGCGRGHDAIALARAGFSVTAIDWIPELHATAGPELERLGGRFVAADALPFRDNEPFDLFWEHTFFSALRPSDRGAWAALVRAALRPGGHLLAIAFPGDRPAEMEGPPFRTSPLDLIEALGAGFAVTEIEAVKNQVPGRQWSEHWVELVAAGGA